MATGLGKSDVTSLRSAGDFENREIKSRAEITANTENYRQLNPCLFVEDNVASWSINARKLHHRPNTRHGA
jgi:hypothetical protein